MVFSLRPELEKLVQDKVAKGDYPSADALVEGAVQRLLDDDSEEEAWSDDIRARVCAAEEEIDQGQYLEYDEANARELSREIHQRGIKKLIKSDPSE
jgi:Arc/MetJ-type ribon-helix-helix transcriptional regulator